MQLLIYSKLEQLKSINEQMFLVPLNNTMFCLKKNVFPKFRKDIYHNVLLE